MYGAGGTPGGAGRFFLGVILLMAGLYLFMSNVRVSGGLTLNHALFYVSGFRVTPGLMLVPLMAGVAMLFFNFRNLAGWVFMFGSLAAIVVGITASLGFYLPSLSVPDMIIISVMVAGGIGLLINSFREYPEK